MTETILSRYAGWSAYLSALAMIFNAVTLVLFFTVGQAWGTINDITIVVLAVLLLDVLLVLYRLHRHGAPTFSLTAYIIGLLGILVALAVQASFVLGFTAYQQTELIVPAGFGLFGLALILFSYLALAGGTLPRGLDIVGIVAGSGYLLLVAGLIAGLLVSDVQVPLSITGSLLAAIFYPLWAIWFGRLIFSGKLTM